MNIVADASVLVAELIRERGQALLLAPNLQVAVTAEQWSETQYGLERRLRHFIERGRASTDQISLIRQKAQVVIHAVEIVPQRGYIHLETIARRRVPRDPNDWPTVALAIALDADILTNDNDFLGCGCATWTFETLRHELAHNDSPQHFSTASSQAVSSLPPEESRS
jgi:predicted nucleic acid-binding protein